MGTRIQVCESGCRPVRGSRQHNDHDLKKKEYFDKYDLAKIREIDSTEIPYWYPDSDLSTAIPYRMLYKKDFRPSDAKRLVDFFTKRNLRALAAWLKCVRENGSSGINDALLFALQSSLFNCSRMLQESAWGGALQRGTYYIPPINRESPVPVTLEYKIRDLERGYKVISNSLLLPQLTVSCESAVDLEQLLSHSVDFIFTDPPYADNVQYGELNFVWEAWLGFDTHWHDEEIIVNEVRGKTEADWADGMRKAMAECFRVLKPGRWLSLCYHDTSEGTWALIQDIMAEVGFIADCSDAALFIDTGQKSYNQLTADKVNKRDLVINFRKPRPGEIALSVVTIPAGTDAKTFRELARAVIREYLQAHPGATKDRVYDDLVSRMVRAGQMEAHNFEEILREVADEVREPRMKNLFEQEDPELFGGHEIGRWYLKEAEEVTVDAAESAREDAAARSVAGFMVQRLKQKYPSLALPATTGAAIPVFPNQPEGVHYSDIFEHYIYAVKDKPRRTLADWLVDYFYKTEEGTWRLPSSEEEARLKAQSRADGTNRRIKRFAMLLETGAPIPSQQLPSSATLAEWIRQCKRTGLYAQGKLLYEKGGLSLDKLSEETQVNVEEDYQVCVRMLDRMGKEPVKRGKRR